MGDMAEPWKSMRINRQNKVASGKRLSMQYHDEKAREKGIAFKHEMQKDFDRWTSEKLDKLGIEYERKGASSFQIIVNGRKGMYYDGKKGEQIRWNDGMVQHGRLEDMLATPTDGEGKK